MTQVTRMAEEALQLRALLDLKSSQSLVGEVSAALQARATQTDDSEVARLKENIECLMREKSTLFSQVESYQKSALEAIDMPRMTDEEKTENAKAVSVLRELKAKFEIDDDKELRPAIAQLQAKVDRLERDVVLREKDADRVSELLMLFKKKGIKTTRNNLSKRVELALTHLDTVLAELYDFAYDEDLIKEANES